MTAAHFRSAKERNLFVFALIFSGLVWLAIVVTIVGLFYAPFVALGMVVAHAFWLARVTGNSIRVGSRQFPDLYKRIENAASKLGMERMPEVYVTTGGGVLNAFATQLFSRSFVILNSEILDACETLDEGKPTSEPRAVDFIIGHELGHLALGHLSWNWLLWPAKLCPLLGPAYSRACEYSSDACGLAVADDVETAGKALGVLAVGGKHARQVSLDALVEQRHDTGSFIMALVELNASHPYLSKRVAAVQRIRDGGYAPEVGRNPFAYLFAPFFAGATTYVLAYAVLIAVFVTLAAKDSATSSGLGNLFAQPTPDSGDALHRDGDEDAEALLAALRAQPLPTPLPTPAAPAGEEPLAAYLAKVGEHDEDDEDEEEEWEDEVAPRFEARTWLKGQAVAKNPQAVSNLSTSLAIAFVEKAYKAGAPKVWVTDVDVDNDGVFAGEVIVEMPPLSKSMARKKLVDLCTAEFRKQGYEEPCEDGGVDALYFYWE